MTTLNTVFNDLRAYNPGTSLPVIVETLGRNALGDGGGGQFQWQASGGPAPNDGTIFDSTAVPGGRWLRVYDQRNVHVSWFGAYGGWDGVSGSGSNDSIGIQKAINAALGKTVVFAARRYRIATPIVLRTATNLKGAGPLDGGTILGADMPLASAPGAITGGPYSVSLSYPPVLYNADALQWLAIEDLVIDGYNRDVFGLYLYRDYYLTIRNVRISRCNRRPYINVLGQLVHHDRLVIYDNGAGAVTFDTTSISFESCGFERNGGDYYLQLRQPIPFAKGGTVLKACWFENDTIGPPIRTPSVGYLGIAGRGVYGSSLFFLNAGAGLNGVACLPANSSLAAADVGLTMTTGAAIGAVIEGVNYATSAGSELRTFFGSGATGCYVHGLLSAPNVDNQSGNTTNQARVIGSNLDFPYMLERFQVRDSAVSGVPGISSAPDAAFYLDVQEQQTRFYGPNNYLRLTTGILEFAANTSMRLQSGDSANYNISISTRSGVSTFDRGHLVLGSHHIWVDQSGKLRIQNGAPTGDTSGVVVGSQS
jgi:hypothetical protein